MAPTQVDSMGEILISLLMRRISLNRLEVNGPAKFRTIRINQRVDRDGMEFIMPLLEIRLRVWVRV